MNAKQTDPVGRVYLVGGGPGDPELITLRAASCLRRADVVLYDYLVNAEILKNAPERAERICLGRHGGSRIWTQGEINQKLVELARNGRTVVRLKGGDPTVFGRAVEEASVLAQAGIPYEIVPGVTSAVAAASCGGVPITHRDFASAVAFVTGQQRDQAEQLDFAALAAFPGTLVFYMGVTTADRWSHALLEGGKPPETPVAIIRHCSRPDQRTIRCRLDQVVDRLTASPRFRPPAVVIVGQVADQRHQMDWFENRPLFGRRILVTRPLHQADDLAGPLAERGAEVLMQPAIQILPPKEWGPVDAALEQLTEFDWLVFSSANGVRFLLDRLRDRGGDARRLGSVRLAAIGPGTAAALEAYHLRADLQPAEYRAESLAASLSTAAEGKRFLLVRASRGREVLAEQLRQAGGHVVQVVVYQSEDVREAAPHVIQRLEAGTIDYITVTSSAIARSLDHLFGERLRRAQLVSISPVTTATLRELGYDPVIEAADYSMPGVVAALENAASGLVDSR